MPTVLTPSMPGMQAAIVRVQILMGHRLIDHAVRPARPSCAVSLHDKLSYSEFSPFRCLQ